ncbi:hypothetical protein ACO0R3_000887 [Hanseniaspora guilliermondii]
MSDQSHSEEFDQYLDIQDDETQPLKASSQIDSNVEAALAAYAHLVEVSHEDQPNIEQGVIREHKPTLEKVVRLSKSKNLDQSKKKKTKKEKPKKKEQTLEKGMCTLIMSPKIPQKESTKVKQNPIGVLPEGMNIIKFSQYGKDDIETAGKKRKTKDPTIDIEFKVNKERLVPKKMKQAKELTERPKRKEPTNSYKPLHNKSKIFTKEEDTLINKLINTHCVQHKVTKEEFIDLIWMNDNTHKVTKTEFWKLLANEFPDRSRSSLYKHVKRKYNNFKPRGKWSTSEDLKLKELCDKHDNKWNVIGQILERMPEDCRDRYRNYVKHNKRLDQGDTDEKEQDKKSVSRWTETESTYLNNIICFISNLSLQFYLKFCYDKDLKAKNNDKFEEWGEYLKKQEKSLLELDSIKEKYNDVYLLVLNSINLNKQQKNSTDKLKKSWIGLKADLNKTMKQQNKELINHERFDIFFKENESSFHSNYFLMDIQKLINWTFISDLFSNGRTRIQVRYKCKSLIKQRINLLEKQSKATFTELLTSIMKAMHEVSSSLNDGNVYEDEIDWFYSYTKWIEITDKHIALEQYKDFNVDPWLMKEMYTYAKFVNGIPDDMNNLSKIIDSLKDKMKF